MCEVHAVSVSDVFICSLCDVHNMYATSALAVCQARSICYTNSELNRYSPLLYVWLECHRTQHLDILCASEENC